MAIADASARIRLKQVLPTSAARAALKKLICEPAPQYQDQGENEKSRGHYRAREGRNWQLRRPYPANKKLDAGQGFGAAHDIEAEHEDRDSYRWDVF
jgi:hypothetical protein